MENNYPSPNQNYKVLVRCSTYNQSRYIEDALNGFAMQQTNFPFVCLVVDDCSTDGEQEVINSWISRECDMEEAQLIDISTAHIVIVPHHSNSNCTMAIYLLKTNLFKQRELKMAHVSPWRNHCEYEALCEGDDYWIDPLKLQKQVDFLENHKDYGLVCTDFDIISEGVHEYRLNNNWVKDDGEVLKAILLGKLDVGTLTVLYRKSVYDNLPHLYVGENFLMGDLPLWIEFAFTSKIKYLKIKTACYRRLNNSASHSTDFHKRKIFLESVIACRLFYIKKLGLEYLEKDVDAQKEFILLKESSLEGQKKEAFSYFLSFLRKKPKTNHIKAVCYLLSAYFHFLNRMFLALKKV